MKHIAESELILNDRGAIYHLNLRPDEIAKHIITVGDPERVADVSKHFDKIDFKTQHREFITHTGFIGSKRFSVVSTGIGTDNIDIVFNELDALVNIDFETRTVKNELTKLEIVRIGTSGALQKSIPLDSFLVSSYGIGLDNLLNFYVHDNSRLESELLSALSRHVSLDKTSSVPYIAAADSGLLNRFANFYKGITVTCPGFYGPQGRIMRADVANPQLIDELANFKFDENIVSNFEMETAGIYGLSKILGHQALSLNAIIANRATQKFSSDPKSVIDKIISKTLEILSA